MDFLFSRGMWTLYDNCFPLVTDGWDTACNVHFVYSQMSILKCLGEPRNKLFAARKYLEGKRKLIELIQAALLSRILNFSPCLFQIVNWFSLLRFLN